MEVTDEMLMALADGELDEGTAARLRGIVAKDPALQRQLAAFTDSADLLRAAMQPGPVPERLVQAIMAAPAGPSGNVVPMTTPAFRPMALAALVAGLAFSLGGYLMGQRQGAPLPDLSGLAVLASGEEITLPDGSRMRMLGSYETDLGLCRMASVEGGATVARQILCRDGADWRLALQVETPADSGFVPASDSLSSAADLWLDSAGAGPALDPQAEAAALKGGG